MQRSASVSTFGREADEKWERERRKVVPLISPARANGHASEDAFTLTRLDAVSPERIDWIWEGYLARGKLALLGGDPEMGKSMITIDIATRLSKGDRWPPHKARAPIGSTIFICSEDAIADTVRPRAEAAGADLTKLNVFKSAVIKNGKNKTFSLQDDLNLLENAIKLTGDVQLVGIDAVTSYVARLIVTRLPTCDQCSSPWPISLRPIALRS
jgi:putative DNA primase/helicase